ncbi:MAG: efflux RND transporter periplasmic adaptor subunit [Gammaproteobacteria bacterium]
MSVREIRLKFLFSAAALIAAGLLTALWWHMHAGHTGKPLETATVRYGDILRTVSTSGTLDPVVLVNVGTQVSGTVNRLYANFNDHVRKGQVLLTLDPTLFKAQVQLDQANLKSDEANLHLAEVTAARIQRLYNQDYETRQDLDQAIEAREAAADAVKAVQAQLLHDETNLSYTVIRSPVDGSVIDREVELGQTVAASLQTPTLFLIGQDLTQMQIDTYVSEADIGQVRPGNPAAFTVYAYPGRIFHGQVVQIREAPITVQNVVTYDVIVSASNPRGLLLPGMTADVTLTTADIKHVLRVPRAALAFTPPAVMPKPIPLPPDGRRRLWVQRAGRWIPVLVTPGIANDEYVQIVGGNLAAGERVAVGEVRPLESASLPAGQRP